MKRILFLFIGALVVWFVIFAITFWMFDVNFNLASSIATGGASGGFFVDLLKRKKTKELS